MLAHNRRVYLYHVRWTDFYIFLSIFPEYDRTHFRFKILYDAILAIFPAAN
ncbi:hypothetical protein T07_4540 [Trichinella nelsoni]|uniref:Uncharacterized protein n=1 Tax=Trichinella nelsoni TaxID=6336 RepID=A0A0V0RDA1_9BILA|nr:hypothetical protein T07_4540 [Trichinella nelsoni]